MEGRTLRIQMTQPQADFYQLTEKYPAFVGGFGTGKTETLANCALRDALSSSSALIALYEPTYDLVRLILAPRMEEKLTDMGIRYKYNKQENIIYTSSPNCGDFVLRTLENPARIIGYESYRAHVDEIDTLKKTQAAMAWRKIIARNRQQPSDIERPFNRVSAYTTPEGFQFVYDTWGRNPKPGYVMIQAATYTNPFLPDDYVQTLRDSYPAALIDAYIEGRFTNLTSGSVYPNFCRKQNHTDATIRPGEQLHIGMDFNINRMAATVHVIRDGLPLLLEEATHLFDTPAMIVELKRRYPGHSITVYPDASGKNRKSVSGSESDHSLLRAAGFMVMVNPSNPMVRDRVLAVNAMLLNIEQKRRYLVNTDNCPVTTQVLEQQAYAENGEPNKDGTEDPIDALGYFIVQRFPIAGGYNLANVSQS